ncbi:hypothetical protein BG004_003404, partial [Podila humilis]
MFLAALDRLFFGTQLFAYADALAQIIRNQQESAILLQEFDMFMSNAQLNVSKTVVFPLAKPDAETKSFFQEQNLVWYDKDFHRTEYLGYPIVCCRRQLTYYYNSLLEKITTSLHIHSQRSLSVMGDPS